LAANKPAGVQIVELVILIVVLALFEYIWFSAQTGKARVKYKIVAPAVSGHPVFERHFRVQQNTLEQLIIFIPALFSFGYMAASVGWPGYEIAAALGVVWLIGRALYARSYVRDPKQRGVGFLLTLLPSVTLLVGTLVCVLLTVV
jgi:uncharacterized MAPEG superfamily protein